MGQIPRRKRSLAESAKLGSLDASVAARCSSASWALAVD